MKSAASKCLPSRCVCGFCGTYGKNGPPTEEQFERWREELQRKVELLTRERA